MTHIIGFAGYSNSGKTTLISKIVCELQIRGYRVAVLKHDAHGHYKEAEGSDSDVFMKSGADTVVTVSPDAFHMTMKQTDSSLGAAIQSIPKSDYVVIEGFKSEQHPKIAVFRNEMQMSIIEQLDPKPIAAATDMQGLDLNISVFHLNAAAEIVNFLELYFTNK
ncbi:molybdopterin-guanine dinucleotide biosynthesis protein B [Paenibacillus hexagrammi]|uniref:Molybdopterin-guanine dinucleotide biosynthesis protein B n=1 Tax=Paenibacillus hexagrammi TaxID=2908839 RepID=A0ABY3SEH6_9BACL|nr:molybdopterin-guanine dinucleotide biosynthesis protein B [Paenibacillus sp. YPD9-1]UJF31591.1 molybdopterin-guanine dinucleotide biosynthesis protein B [Paenibacillus sp. YPD9-1]